MKNGLSQLQHVRVPIEGQGEVIVLDTGAAIGSESTAMLQALHSRSIGGFDSHMKALSERGSARFMSSFYVGYGHQSIGDCGSTTIFIEGVSMLAAKAIQDWPLYSGQEASTRYIDFQTQSFINPLETPEGDEILERWRTFYVDAMPSLIDDLKSRFQINEGEKESVYEKAITARAFDILRGFLPTGASTNLAWHTNLRQAADKLMYLRNHPLAEVRNIAVALQSALEQAHSNSFGQKLYDATEGYNQEYMLSGYYFSPDEISNDPELRFNLWEDVLAEHEHFLQSRPAKTLLPDALKHAGGIQAEFLLDFGSFRDLQRHRALAIRMPLVSSKFGFHDWYLSELPVDLREKAVEMLDSQIKKIGELSTPPETIQYYLPMGMKCPIRITGDLPSWIYMLELRATRFVHFTLREVAGQIAGMFSEELGSSGLRLHLDEEPDRFDVKRGEHDIVQVN